MVSVLFSRGVRRASRAVSTALSAAVVLSATSAFAGSITSASQVISYTQGTGLSASVAAYNDPTSALGVSANLSDVGMPFESPNDTFSPPFDLKQIVTIGTGGQITLQLANSIKVANAPQLGVFSNVGLAETPFGSGMLSNPVTIFGGGVADVQVSSDGKTWADLGNITFDLPSSAYSKLDAPYDIPGPTAVASDFSKPFTGTLSDFNGETFAQTLTTLNGSGGGTWLNVSSSHLATVDFVQFRNPLGTPWVPGNPQQFALDAVTAAAGSTVSTSVVPTPAAAPMGLLMLAVLGVWVKMRKVARVS